MLLQYFDLLRASNSTEYRRFVSVFLCSIGTDVSIAAGLYIPILLIAMNSSARFSLDFSLFFLAFCVDNAGLAVKATNLLPIAQEGSIKSSSR